MDKKLTKIETFKSNKYNYYFIFCLTPKSDQNSIEKNTKNENNDRLIITLSIFT